MNGNRKVCRPYRMLEVFQGGFSWAPVWRWMTASRASTIHRVVARTREWNWSARSVEITQSMTVARASWIHDVVARNRDIDGAGQLPLRLHPPGAPGEKISRESESRAIVILSLDQILPASQMLNERPYTSQVATGAVKWPTALARLEPAMTLPRTGEQCRWDARRRIIGGNEPDS